jgi:hypothetical protein
MEAFPIFLAKVMEGIPDKRHMRRVGLKFVMDGNIESRTIIIEEKLPSDIARARHSKDQCYLFIPGCVPGRPNL